MDATTRLVALPPGSPAHAVEVASWAQASDEAMAWCSHVGHPIPAEVVAAWGQQEDCSPYMLFEGSAPVAYGELWIEPNEVELARLIVAPGHRRRGFGATLTLALLAEARKHAADVYLRVRPDNHRALRLYRRIGFHHVDPELAQQWNAEQPVAYVWMEAQPLGH